MTSIAGTAFKSNCFLLIVQRFFGKRQGTLLHLFILIGIDQIPVKILDLGDGEVDLLSKGDVRELAIILCEPQPAEIRAKPNPCRSSC